MRYASREESVGCFEASAQLENRTSSLSNRTTRAMETLSAIGRVPRGFRIICFRKRTFPSGSNASHITGIGIGARRPLGDLRIADRGRSHRSGDLQRWSRHPSALVETRASVASVSHRYRCSACGNRTRFDVVATRRTRAFHHYDLGGTCTIEEEEILDESIENVTCRWCGRSNAIEDVDGADELEGGSQSDVEAVKTDA